MDTLGSVLVEVMNEHALSPYRGDRPLRGLQEIGAYLQCHPHTARKYIQKMGLPASQLRRRCGQTVWITSPRLIDMWILAQDRLRRQAERDGPHEMEPCVMEGAVIR